MADGHLSWRYYARLMYSALFFSLCLAILPGPIWAATIDFNGLAVGTRLDNQFPGITFLKYQGVIGGIVDDAPFYHVARFNDAPGCEFCGSGARMVFSALQRNVTFHVGLFPGSGVVQQDIRLTAFGADGVPRATTIVNVATGAVFDTVISATTAAPEIFLIVLEPVGFGWIAVRDITFDAGTASGPDFFVEATPWATVVQGGASVDVPLTILCFGGSTGDISFSLGPLPAGVSGAFVPNPSSGNSVTLRLQAASGPVAETKQVVITGTPSQPSAGPAPRNSSIIVATVPKLHMWGAADIDFAGCAPSGARGTVTRDYQVWRDLSVNNPINVALEGLPSDVTGTVDPQTLQFPGNALGQRVTVSLTTIAGPTVPDTMVTLHLTGDGIDMPFSILLHGSCPQQNRNFVIRGQFGYLNAQDVEPDKGFQPLKGAQVEIFRFHSGWYDDKVGETYADDEGRFTLDLYASRDGDYYARLRLYSPEVEFEDADRSSVWSTDTRHQSNRGGLIEVGSIAISRDGGRGTPRAAVWQGFRNAALEFANNFHQTVPAGHFKVQSWRGHLIPLTWYDEVRWPFPYPTGDPVQPGQQNGNPYRITKHEFAHVFRDVLDGSIHHWHQDDFRYFYGRDHGSCSILTGTEANAGFAFHEGWAEYWSNDITCCPGDEGNQNIEGTVAHDLNNLANKLSPDREISRKGMLSVLQRGPNLIHSDTEFRREYAKQFPGVALGSISDGCLPGPPLAAEDRRMHPDGLDPAEQRKNLLAAIDSREQAIGALKEQQRVNTGLRTFVLRAAIEEESLVVLRMRDELPALDRGDPPERFLQRAALEELRRREFVAKRKAIQVHALQDASAAVSAEQRPAVERRIRLLQESRIEDDSLDSMLSLPAVAGDDTVATAAPLHPRWLLWLTLVLALVVVALLVVYFRRRGRGIQQRP